MSQPIALWGLAWRCACFLGSVWSLQCGHEGKMGCETKSKALSSNTEMHQEKCLSAVQSQYIWTSKHSRKAPTRHASMWLFSYALFCSNQVEPPYFSVSLLWLCHHWSWDGHGCWLLPGSSGVQPDIQPEEWWQGDMFWSCGHWVLVRTGQVSFPGRLEMGQGKFLSPDQHIFAFAENTHLFAQWAIHSH